MCLWKTLFKLSCYADAVPYQSLKLTSLKKLASRTARVLIFSFLLKHHYIGHSVHYMNLHTVEPYRLFLSNCSMGGV